jgi:hypothetical protein
MKVPMATCGYKGIYTCKVIEVGTPKKRHDPKTPKVKKEPLEQKNKGFVYWHIAQFEYEDTLLLEVQGTCI